MGLALHVGLPAAGLHDCADQFDVVDVALSAEESTLGAKEGPAIGVEEGFAVETVERHGIEATLYDLDGRVTVVVAPVIRLEDQPRQSAELPWAVADGDVRREPSRPSATAKVGRRHAAQVAEYRADGVGHHPRDRGRGFVVAAGNVELFVSRRDSPSRVILVEVVVSRSHPRLFRMIARAKGLERQRFGCRATVGVVPQRVIIKGMTAKKLARARSDSEDHGVRLRRQPSHRVALHRVAIMHLYRGRLKPRVMLRHDLRRKK